MEKVTISDFLFTAYKTVTRTNAIVGKSPTADWTESQYEEAIDNALARIQEEFFVELVGAPNTVDYADALCDTFVVLSGLFDVLQKRDNLPDIDFGRVLSGVPYESLNMELVNLQDIKKSPDLVRTYLNSISLSMMTMVEIDCMALLIEVLENNLSKFPESEAVANSSLQWYKENTEETEIVVKPLLDNSGFWLCRTRDNKYMKPKPFYNEVDASMFTRFEIEQGE